MEVSVAYGTDGDQVCASYVAEPRRRFDLEERTYRFAKKVMAFTRRCPRDLENREVIKQLVRSAGSVGANYIEANDGLSLKDSRMRIKISRKEAKESRYWLRLIRVDHADLNEERSKLIQEAKELTLIFGAILKKTAHKV